MKTKIASADSTLKYDQRSMSIMSTLSPARDILHTIHFDHLYSTPGNSQQSTNAENPRPIDENKPSCSWDYKSTDEERHKVRCDCNEHSGNTEVDTDMDSLNADSIQQVFQNMIDMTALTPITDFANSIGNFSVDPSDLSGGSSNVKSSTPASTCDSRINKIKLVKTLPNTQRLDLLNSKGNLRASEIEKTAENAPGTQTNSGDVKNDNIVKRDRKYKSKKHEDNIISKCTKEESDSKTVTPTEVCEDEWNSKVKCLEAEREMNTLLNYTAELLVLRWREYLSMTMEEIRRFEVMNAKEIGAVEEVVEMLEDKDRYVWQLIEELQFH